MTHFGRYPACWRLEIGPLTILWWHHLWIPLRLKVNRG